jgi:hypothetical protein
VQIGTRPISLFVLVALCVVGLGLGAAIVWNARHPSNARPAAAVISSPTAANPGPIACRSVNGLPDTACTPGLPDPRVTQDNIHTTICISGYTKTVRPSTRYTNALKVQQIKQYGYADTNLADYEEDHLIPLELGGHPTDPRNLWPEPRAGDNAATNKDRVENALHKKVCAGLVTLMSAQTAIAVNWEVP